MSGGVAGAEAATLTFMVGGSEAAFARAQPILQQMGKAVIHAGAPGNGQAAKICNNMMLGHLDDLGVARRSCWPSGWASAPERCSRSAASRRASAGR